MNIVCEHGGNDQFNLVPNWSIDRSQLPMLARAISKLPNRVGPNPFFTSVERFRYTQYLCDWLRNRTDMRGTRYEQWTIEFLAEELQRHWEYGEADFPRLVAWLLCKEMSR